MSKSPCIRICRLNEEGWCVGCGMTIRDLRVWRNVNEEEREKIVAQSRNRVAMQKLRDEGLSDD